jgi:hypothetical protein
MKLLIKSGQENFEQKITQNSFAKDDLFLVRTEEALLKNHPVENIFLFSNLTKISLFQRLITATREKRIKEIYLIADYYPQFYLKFFLLLLSLLCSASFSIDVKGRSYLYGFSNAFYDILESIFSPVISILLSPLFFVREVSMNFILPKEMEESLLISMGRDRGLSNLTYWYSYSNRIKNGVFGYAFNEYLGVQTSLFNFPLAQFCLYKLKFRNTFLIGVVSVFLGGLFLFDNNTNFEIQISFLIIFLVMMSNVVWAHASLGVYEIFAWGFGVLGTVFFIKNFLIISGFLIGLTVLSHLGVATLICGLLLVYSALFELYVAYTLIGIVAFITASYWFIPYFINRKSATRTQMINEEWNNQYKFGQARLVQFFVYSIFPLLLQIYSNDVKITIVATVPLFVAYYNAKIKWLFSPYTITMFMAVTGIICLSLAFNIYAFFALLYFLYLPPKNLSWPNHIDRFHYRFSLSSRKDLWEGAVKLFDGITHENRIGFEAGPNRSGGNLFYEYFSIFLAYYLSDKDCEIFNTGMKEMVKFDLYKETVRNFNEGVSFETLQRSIIKSGISHIVVYSDDFKKMLEANGFIKHQTIEFDFTLKGEFSKINATLYKIPFENNKVTPSATIQIGKNCLNITFSQSGDYTLSYSFDIGLICAQSGKAIKLQDNGEGLILIKNVEEGKATISYSHNRLFSKMFRKN